VFFPSQGIDDLIIGWLEQLEFLEHISRLVDDQTRHAGII